MSLYSGNSLLIAVPLNALTEMLRSKIDGLEKNSPNWNTPLSSSVLIIDWIKLTVMAAYKHN